MSVLLSLLGHSTQLIMEGNGNLGFEEFLLLLGTRHTMLIVS